MANGGQGSTLRFTCDECGTHLGVDESLAGLEAPCPKCGAVVVAPNPRSRQIQVPSSGVVRGVSGGGGFQASPRERSAVPASVSRSGSQSSGPSKERKVVVSGGQVPNEMRVLVKILIATALVVFVVVLVTWFLKNQ